MSLRCRLLAVLLSFLGVSGGAAAEDKSVPDEARLRALAARFAPADIGTDVKRLPESERQALVKLVQAARLLDAIFLRQVWAGNESLLLETSSTAWASFGRRCSACWNG